MEIMVDKDNRVIYLSDDVDKESIGKISFEILKLISEDNEKESKEVDFKRKPIHLHINSHGGEVYDMWALIDIILQSKTPIYTYCTGYAMSAGLKIFLSGHKRFVGRHATFLYHQLSCWKYGTYQEHAEYGKELNRQQTMIEEFVKSRTHIIEDTLTIIREKKQNWYIGCEEAIKLGIATDIME